MNRKEAKDGDPDEGNAGTGAPGLGGYCLLLIRPASQDGSWKRRLHGSKPSRPYFERGFPHGKDQLSPWLARLWPRGGVGLATWRWINVRSTVGWTDVIFFSSLSVFEAAWPIKRFKNAEAPYLGAATSGRSMSRSLHAEPCEAGHLGKKPSQ